MLFNTFITVLLIASVIASNEVTLVNWQTNITVGDNVTNSSVVISSFDKIGSNCVNSYLTFFNESNTGVLTPAYNVTFNETMLDAKLKNDGQWVAAIGTTNNVLYMLRMPSTQYTINQTISLGNTPNSLSWAYDDEMLIVGMNNGSVLVFGRNSTTNQYFQSQVLSTNHSSVANVSGQMSRFVTCGNSDQNINIFYYNPVTAMYLLNQSITSVGTAGCSALNYAEVELRIAVGQTTGNVYIL
jgi:hypothetical protein